MCNLIILSSNRFIKKVICYNAIQLKKKGTILSLAIITLGKYPPLYLKNYKLRIMHQSFNLRTFKKRYIPNCFI